MKQPYWGDQKPMQIEGITHIQEMGDQRGDEGWVGILLSLEDVRVDSLHMLEGGRLGVDVDRTTHDGIESPNLVEAEEVIDVMMGVEDRITPAKFFPQRLLPEVR